MEDADVDRHDPVGSYNLGEDFFRAALHLAAAQDNNQLELTFDHTVSYHLHSHSIELVLKAFLRVIGVSNNDLKGRYGHNMKAMLDDTLLGGLMLGRDEERVCVVVKLLNAHGRAQTFRYFEAGYYQLPSLADVRAANERLLEAVKGHLPLLR